MDFIPDAIQTYAEQHSAPESALLRQINRDTHADVLSPRMLSGHLQGRLLAMISKMTQPQSILEIGTYTGYSALCLAEGLRPDGKLITIDRNEEIASRVRAYFALSPWQHQLELVIADAKAFIPTLDEVFDLVFIDADKAGYQAYFDLVVDKVRAGGIIIADNVLWSGKVVADQPDRETLAMKAFNDTVCKDARVEPLLLPVRDGLLLLRKI